MGKGETSDKKESWSQPKEGERASSEPTHEMHQWYVRTYEPQVFLSIGNCGPGEEDKSLEGMLFTTPKNAGIMAGENMFLQATDEVTIEAGKEVRITADEELLGTSPGKIAMLAGHELEFIAFGSLNGGTKGDPFTPILGDAEDGGLTSIKSVEDARKKSAKARTDAIHSFAEKHHADHTAMRNFGVAAATVEAMLGTYFAFKSKHKLGALTGGVTVLAGGATVLQDFFMEKALDDDKTHDGVASLDGFKQVSLYGGDIATLLGGKYAKVEAIRRVFIESAGMVSAAASIFSAFGAVNAEVMGGASAGLLAGLDAEVNGGRNVTIEAQKGHMAIEVKGKGKHLEIAAEHGTVKIEGHDGVLVECEKDVHVSAKEAVHIAAEEKDIAIQAEKGGIHITAEDGVITLHAKTIQLQGEDEVSLLVGGSGVTVKDGSVVIKDGSGSHKFSGGQLDSVTAAALASAKKQFKSAISKLKQQYGQLKDRMNSHRDQLRALKTGKA